MFYNNYSGNTAAPVFDIMNWNNIVTLAIPFRILISNSLI